MESPCQNLCHLDEITGWCDGCGRTGAEIASWIKFSPVERRAIMATLPQRMASAVRVRFASKAS